MHAMLGFQSCSYTVHTTGWISRAMLTIFPLSICFVQSSAFQLTQTKKRGYFLSRYWNINRLHALGNYIRLLSMCQLSCSRYWLHCFERYIIFNIQVVCCRNLWSLQDINTFEQRERKKVPHKNLKYISTTTLQNPGWSIRRNWCNLTLPVLFVTNKTPPCPFFLSSS